MNTAPIAIPLWKKFLFVLVALLIFFAGIEGGLVLIGVKPLILTEDPFVGFAGNLPLFVEQVQPDGTVMLATAENKLRNFNAQQFPKVKGPNTYRIFCMGESTTYGHPFEDPTSFCGWLREFLPAADPTRTWEVINAGGISYASYRVANLMSELSQYKSDLFIVYVGQNEFLEERTYRKIFNLPEWVVRAKIALSGTRTFTVVSRGIEALSGKRTERTQNRDKMAGEVKEILNTTVGPTSYTRNDVLKSEIIRHYALNLRRMILIARSAGSRIMFVNPAVNLKDMPPFKSENAAGLTDEAKTRWTSLYREGNRLLENEKYAEAATKYADALNIDDRHADLHYRMGKTLFALKRYEEAENSFQRAIDEDICPLRILSPMSRAVREIAVGDGVSLVDYVALIKNDCPHKYGHSIAGREYFVDHVHPTIEGYRMLGLALLDRMAAEGIVQKGPRWNDAAIAAITRAVEQRIDPRKKAHALIILGRTLDWAGRLEEGYRLQLEASEILKDNSYDVLGLLGNSAARRGDLPGAIAFYRKALQYAPGSVSAHFNLAYYLQESNNSDEALAHYYEAVRIGHAGNQIDNDVINAHFNIALILSARGQTAEAQDHYAQVLQFKPDHAAAHLNTGILFAKEGRLDEARDHLTAALAIKPDYPVAHYNLGMILDQQGRTDEAMTNYGKALTQDPRFAGAHNNLGVLLARQGKIREAAAHFNEVLAFDPDNVDSHYNLGLALAAEGKNEEAARHFAAARKIRAATPRKHAKGK